MILDIIKAFDKGLLTMAEAKSYIQRAAESEIQQVEAYAQEINARTAKTIDSFKDEDCGCEDECCNVPMMTATQASQKELEETKRRVEEKAAEFFGLLKELSEVENN